MALLWRDIQMVERVTFDGQKQRDALTGFQAASGIDATTAARAVHLSYFLGTSPFTPASRVCNGGRLARFVPIFYDGSSLPSHTPQGR